MKAPNGKPSNLDEKQWVQVRTNNFKNLFGDWEKPFRINKFLSAPDAHIIGDEITFVNDRVANQKAALDYFSKIKGSYVNTDTGIEIEVIRGHKKGGIKEVLHHNYKDEEHIKSIAAIPQIIEKATFITREKNDDSKVNADYFDYYLCGLNIGGEDYMVKVVIVDVKGHKYYDHKLTSVQKGKLVNEIKHPQAGCLRMQWKEAQG